MYKLYWKTNDHLISVSDDSHSVETEQPEFHYENIFYRTRPQDDQDALCIHDTDDVYTDNTFFPAKSKPLRNAKRTIKKEPTDVKKEMLEDEEHGVPNSEMELQPMEVDTTPEDRVDVKNITGSRIGMLSLLRNAFAQQENIKELLQKHKNIPQHGDDNTNGKSFKTKYSTPLLQRQQETSKASVLYPTDFAWTDDKVLRLNSNHSDRDINLNTLSGASRKQTSLFKTTTTASAISSEKRTRASSISLKTRSTSSTSRETASTPTGDMQHIFQSIQGTIF